eukprot:1489771-Pyramimonas_sp.AAC.1
MASSVGDAGFERLSRELCIEPKRQRCGRRTGRLVPFWGPLTSGLRLFWCAPVAFLEPSALSCPPPP